MLRSDAAIDAVGCEDVSERSHREKKVHLRIEEILMGKNWKVVKRVRLQKSLRTKLWA